MTITLAVIIILLWLRGASMSCRLTARVTGKTGYTIGVIAESFLWPIWWMWGWL